MLTVMSQFVFPNPNDNVLEEQIEWNSISNQECWRCCSILETRLLDVEIMLLDEFSSIPPFQFGSVRFSN